MFVIGIILGFVGVGYLCWLLFALAVYALPLLSVSPRDLPPITPIQGRSRQSQSLPS
jgi:hypothetical protein